MRSQKSWTLTSLRLGSKQQLTSFQPMRWLAWVDPTDVESATASPLTAPLPSPIS